MLKAKIREKYKQKRASIPADTIHEKSDAIRDKVAKHFLGKGLTISLFFPIDHHQEVRTQGIYQDYKQNNSRITGSVSDFDSGKLKHLQVNDYESLKPNSMGIPEPSEGQIVKPPEFDMVFVPLFACDQKGYRVGYGKGFYDRFLSQCSDDCLFIGLDFHEPEIIDIEDKNQYDIPLDRLVTPEKLHYFE